MKKLLIAFLLLASVCGAQTLEVSTLKQRMVYVTASQAVSLSGTGQFSLVEIDDNYSAFAGATFTAPLDGFYTFNLIVQSGLSDGESMWVKTFFDSVNYPEFDGYTIARGGDHTDTTVSFSRYLAKNATVGWSYTISAPHGGKVSLTVLGQAGNK
jgi:hypothetical protein